MSIYSLLAVVALYAVTAQHGDRLHYALCAAIVVGGAALLGLVEMSIMFGLDSAGLTFIQPNNIIKITLQLITAGIVFRRIRNSAESDLPAYFGWVAVGWFLIFMAIPFIVDKIL